MSNAATGVVAVGSMLLVAAAGLAVFSQTWATTTPLPENLKWLSPATAGWLALLVAVVVGATVVWTLRRGSWVMPACLALAGVLVMIAYAAWPSGFVANYASLSTGYPPAQEIPSAFAAWMLASIGVAAVFVGGWVLVGWPRVTRTALSAGAAVGVVIAIVVASLILRDADPNRSIDATTAAEIPVPALPKTLGTSEKFTIRFDTPRAHGSRISTVVRAAGPGFAVRTPTGVRAFDSAGRERWHYLHTGDPRWYLEGFGVFDYGTTVVVSLKSEETRSGEAVGLDAMTGRVLWRSNDRSVVGALDRFAENVDIQSNEPLLMLILDPSTLGRIDTRTGRILWRVEVPSGYTPVDSEAGIGYFTNVETGDRIDVHYVSLDPASGDVRFDVIASTFLRSDLGELTSPKVTSPKQAGRNGVVFTAGAGRAQYINVLNGRVFPFDGEVMFPTVLADDSVAETHTFNPYTATWAIRNQSDGSVHCVLPKDVIVGGSDWLEDEVLHSDPAGVTAYRRSDCSKVTPAQPRIPNGYPLAVPGVLLVLDLDPATLVIRGYV